MNGVEKHLFEQEIRWNNVPLPGSYIWKISSEHTACQRIMAKIAWGVSQSDAARKKQQQQQRVADYQLTFHCTSFNNHRASFRFHVFPTLQNAPLLFAETGLLFGKCTCLLSAKRGRWIVSKTIQFWKSNVQQWRVIVFQRNLLMVYI